MDPTETAAAIGVGGTVLVGVAGFAAAIWNTKQTIGRDREARIWDRHADAYVRRWQLSTTGRSEEAWKGEHSRWTTGSAPGCKR